MEQEPFSPEESLQLITNMITQVKNAAANDSFYFLLWGWLVFVAGLGQYILKVVFHSPFHPAIWSLMFVGVIVSVFYGRKQGRKRKVKTYVEEMLDYLWIAVFFSFVLLGFIFSRVGWENCYPFYMLMYAMGTFVSGRALKFPPLVWGAIASWILAIIATFASYETNMLLTSLAILLSYIIPGYLLRNKFRVMEAHV
jgi:hypothetical protein